MFGWFADAADAPIKAMGIARSPKWYMLSRKFLEEHPVCTVCQDKSKGVEAHHIIPVHVCSRLELEVTNLIALCREHHFLFGHLLDWSCYNPAVIKDAKTWRDKIARRE